MGQQLTQNHVDPDRRRILAKKVLADLRVLKSMLEQNLFETGIRRIGAEQEYVVVDQSCRPAPVAIELLERIDDPNFTTELSLFNLEFNADPLVLGGDCLQRLHRQLGGALDRVRAAAAPLGARPLLTGILPTLRKTDLSLKSITPRPRYYQLVQALRDQRGEPYEFRFSGTDELIMRHESVMLEACNTSTQFHLQITPDEFVTIFNIAQAVAGATLAPAVNSPLLFGRRLWHETRIGLFQQAIDTRRPARALASRSARVRFGDGWAQSSPLEPFMEDALRFRVLLGEEVEEDADEELASGRAPKLQALRLHNGTIYRWNRVCYGVTDGKPHLRIENRMLPSGPSVIDEVANATMWFGVVLGAAEVFGDVRKRLTFDQARNNFNRAARLGLDARLRWLDGSDYDAADLVRHALVPLARTGLVGAGVDEDDVNHYLDIVDQRAASRRTGARWMLEGYEHLATTLTPAQSLDVLVAESLDRQQEDRPVHEWEPAAAPSTLDLDRYLRVDQFMTTDVFTVREDDVIDLAASVMDWKHTRHVPVEDDRHELVGLVSYRQLLRFLAADIPHGAANPVPVRDVMQLDPITVRPDTPTIEAMEIMRTRQVPCLPVVRDKRVVGIITDRDFVPIAAKLLEERLPRILNRSWTDAGIKTGHAEVGSETTLIRSPIIHPNRRPLAESPPAATGTGSSSTPGGRNVDRIRRSSVDPVEHGCLIRKP